MTSSKDTHSKNAPPVKENPVQKAPPSSNIKDTGGDASGSEHSKAPKASSPTPLTDPSVVQPVVRSTETLPVEPRGEDDRADAVRHARHAESPEQIEKTEIYEHSKIPPPGSRNYVAGQPVNEEEYDKTEDEASRLAKEGEKQRRDAEKRSQEMSPGGGYHPVDPDYPDPSKRRDTADFGRGDIDDDDGDGDDKKHSKKDR